MSSHLPFHRLEICEGVSVSYVGPEIAAGPLPALFYFSLSAEDSLTLDPFNQPVAYLAHLPLRIFSLTLPGHENNLPPTQAIHAWAQEFVQGNNVIASFVDQVKVAVKTLIHRGILLPDKIGVAGLSRGAFIAAHTAAAIPEFRWILGFAPLIQLTFAKEFETIAHDPVIHSLSLDHLTKHLYDRHVRFYIGNLDTLVSTRLCFAFIEKLAQTAQDHGLRSPDIEMIITPSIGRHGHGTAKHTFHEGAQWIAEKLGAIDVV